MRLVSFITCLMIFSLSYLTSCTSKPSELAVSPGSSAIVEQSPHPTSITPSSDPIDKDVTPNEQVTEVIDATIIYNPDITFDELKKSVRLGEHIDETIKILGTDYDEYPSYYIDDMTFRYYFANVEDHSYQFTHIHDNIVNDFDKEGLLNENIKYQLTVWTIRNIVTTYAISYKHSDGKIHMYYEWPDGYSKEDIYE